MITRSNEVIWVSDIVEVIRDETDDTAYLIGILIDITDRKDFQVRLKESEEKYRLLIENTSDRATARQFKPDDEATQESYFEPFPPLRKMSYS